MESGHEQRVVECKSHVAIGKGSLSAFGYECAGRTLGPQIREGKLGRRLWERAPYRGAKGKQTVGINNPSPTD